METASYFGALMKMLLALGVVLALMIMSVYVLRRLLGHPASLSGEGEAIKVLAVRSLGPKSNILIIDTLGKVVVLGVTGNAMHVITTLEDSDQLNALRRLRERHALPSSPLWDKIRQKVGKA